MPKQLVALLHHRLIGSRDFWRICNSVLNIPYLHSVVPVFKNDGERSDPGKYRPISILPLSLLLMIA